MQHHTHTHYLLIVNVVACLKARFDNESDLLVSVCVCVLLKEEAIPELEIDVDELLDMPSDLERAARVKVGHARTHTHTHDCLRQMYYVNVLHGVNITYSNPPHTITLALPFNQDRGGIAMETAISFPHPSEQEGTYCHIWADMRMQNQHCIDLDHKLLTHLALFLSLFFYVFLILYIPLYNSQAYTP